MEPIPCKECYIQLFSSNDPEQLTKKISTFLGHQPDRTKLIGTTNLQTEVIYTQDSTGKQPASMMVFSLSAVDVILSASPLPSGTPRWAATSGSFLPSKGQTW